MACVTTVLLPHHHDYPAHVALFKGVQNAPFLQERLIKRDEEFEYAFLDAANILSTTHLLAGVSRALVDMKNKRLRSHNVHSEIVFCLSPNNNIAESFRRFGISSNTRAVLAVKIQTSTAVNSEYVQSHLSSAIQGSQVAFSDEELAELSNLEHVSKLYRLDKEELPSRQNSRPAQNQVQLRTEKEEQQGAGHRMPPCNQRRHDIERTILSIMALRGS